MKVLVTGAAGFVGTNFLNRVKNQSQWQVVGVFRKKKPVIVANNIRYVQADLRNWDDCRRVVEDVDWICMFAGRLSTMSIAKQDPLGPVSENTIINTQMLDSANQAGVKKFLWLSSSTGYPDMDRPMKEEDFFVSEPPVSYAPTGNMYRYIERLAYFYATRSNFPMQIVTLRPTAIFGEYDDFNFATCHALPALVRYVVERVSPIEIKGSGEDERDWVYVGDVVDACLLALQQDLGIYEVFNIGCGHGFSLNQILEYLLDMDAYRQAEVIHRLQESGAPVLKRRFDCSYVNNRLGFRCKTPLKIALANTVNWYRTHAQRDAKPVDKKEGSNKDNAEIL